MLGTNFQFQTTWLVPASIRIAGRCGLSGVPPASPWLYPASSSSQGAPSQKKLLPSHIPAKSAQTVNFVVQG